MNIISCYPFSEDRDVFILEDLPHVYFVGNMKNFGTKIIYSEEE